MSGIVLVSLVLEITYFKGIVSLDFNIHINNSFAYDYFRKRSSIVGFDLYAV